MAIRNEDFWIGVPLFNRPERMEKVATDLAVGLALDLRQAIKRAPLEQWLAAAAERIATAYIYDMGVDEQLCAPRDESWREWLTALKGTRLKTVVMLADPNQDDSELKQSKAFLEDCLH